MDTLGELVFESSGKAREREVTRIKHERADMAGWMMWSKTKALENEEARIELYWFELHGSCLFHAKSKEAARDGCYLDNEINLGGAEVQLKLADPERMKRPPKFKSQNRRLSMRRDSYVDPEEALEAWRSQNGVKIKIHLAALSVPIHLIAAPEEVADVFAEQHTMEEWCDEMQAAARNFKAPSQESSLCEMTRNLAPLMNRPIEFALYVSHGCRTMAAKQTLDQQIYLEMGDKFEEYALDVMDGCRTMMEAEAVLRGCGGHLFDVDVYTFAEQREMKVFMHCKWVRQYTEDMWKKYDLQARHSLLPASPCPILPSLLVPARTCLRFAERAC